MAPLAGAYAARAFPKAVTIPALPIDRKVVDVHEGAQSEFVLRDKTEVQRAALDRIVDSLKKGGWEVMMIDAPRQPPLATLKLTTDDNRVMWASVELFETARLLVLEQDES